MNADTDRTDIIPGLRAEDTPRLGVPALSGRHRARRGPMSRLALVVLLGVPTAVVGLTAGLLLPGRVGGSPQVAVSPSPRAADPTTAEPVPSLPSPTRSRADRSRPRESRRPGLTPPTSPTTHPTTPQPTPSSTRQTEAPTGSPSPTTEPPFSGIPTVTVEASP